MHGQQNIKFGGKYFIGREILLFSIKSLLHGSLGFQRLYISCVYFKAFPGVRLENVFIFCRPLASSCTQTIS